MRTRRLLGFVLVCSTCQFAVPAECGTILSPGTAISQNLETSIRAAGMGGATTAVGWGEPGNWGNPAALASTQGIGWLEGNTRLYPELSNNIRFKSRRFLVGTSGVGVSLMGEPAEWLGHTRLEFDQSYGTDPFGNPTGPFDATEKIEGFGVGLSPLKLWSAIPWLSNSRVAALAHVVDLSAGYQHKRTRLPLGPGTPEAVAENHDWGISSSVAVIPGGTDGRSTRVEIAGGLAEVNADGAAHFIVPGYGDLGSSTSIRRTGAAVRAVLPFGARPAKGEATPWSWWPVAVPSAVEIGVAYDRERRTTPGPSVPEHADHWGLEVAFMQILAARIGYVEDLTDDLHAVSAGLGLHVPVGPWATLGYDYANVPVGNGLQNQNRHGYSAWIHPGSIWKAWEARR